MSDSNLEYRSKLSKGFKALDGIPSKFWSPIEVMEKHLLPLYKEMEKEGKIPSPDNVAIHLSFLIQSYRIQHIDQFGSPSEFYDSLPYLCQK